MLMSNMSEKLYFLSPLLLDKSTKIEIGNINLDYIKFDEALSEFVSEQEWNYDTILLAHFRGNLEGGNVEGVNNLPIEQLLLKKRKKDELTWHNVKVFDYNKDVERYNFKDKLVEALQDYEYSVQPISAGGILCDESLSEVETDFDGIWLIGTETSHQIRYNTEISSIQTNTVQNMVTTLGSKYPFLITNGSIAYKTFNVKGRLMSNETLNGNSGVDRKAEKKLRESINKFLGDRKPKIIKDDSGNYVLVQINNDIVLEPINDLGRQMYDVSFSVTEIGDAYDENLLLSYGLIKKEDLGVV